MNSRNKTDRYKTFCFHKIETTQLILYQNKMFAVICVTANQNKTCQVYLFVYYNQFKFRMSL